MAINEYPYTDFNEYNMDWIIKTVKDLTVEWAATKTEWTDMKTELEALKLYITNYFDNLDVDQEISDKIDEMVADGTFLDIIRSTVTTEAGAVTSAWIADNLLQETGYVLDKSLTVEDAAADAKAAGDRITALEEATGVIDFGPANFARGDLSSSGNVITRNYRVITPNTFNFAEECKIIVDPNYTGYLWLYPVGDSAYNTRLNGAIIPANTDARVVIRLLDEDQLPADVDTFAKAITIMRSEVDIDMINHESWKMDDSRIKAFTYNNCMDKISNLKNQSATAAEIDYKVRFQDMPYSVSFITKSSATSSEIRITIDKQFSLAGTQEFDMMVYLEDSEDITNMQLIISGTGFTKYSSETLHDGWNKLRIYSQGAGTWDPDTPANLMRIVAHHSTGIEKKIYIGSITQVKPPHPSMIIIADGPYYTFYTEAYPALTALGVPVVWALDPTLLDAPDASPRHLINEDELELLMDDGISEFSFHSYDLTAMSTATAQEALYDTLQNIRFLKTNAIDPEHIWRAAWLQNNCAHPELANNVMKASASYDGSAGLTYYPFPDKYNIPRVALHGKSTDDIDAIFDNMKNQHNVILLYTHGISNDAGDTTSAMLTYFLTKLSNAITNDGMIVTTYSRLINEYDIK